MVNYSYSPTEVFHDPWLLRFYVKKSALRLYIRLGFTGCEKYCILVLFHSCIVNLEN